jgi:hypothetical protein
LATGQATVNRLPCNSSATRTQPAAKIFAESAAPSIGREGLGRAASLEKAMQLPLALGVLVCLASCATPAGPAVDHSRTDVDMAAGVGGVGAADADMARAASADADLASADAVDLAMAASGPDLATPPDLATTSGCSAADHVVINEIKIGGTTLSDEFIELYNPCARDVSLASWTLSHYSAQGTSETPITTLKLAAPIAGHGYVLIASEACGCKSSADQTYTNAAFSADGGGLGLRNAQGSLVDAVGYGAQTNNPFMEDKPAAAPDSGKSLGRHPNGTDSDHNQGDFAVASTPTPRTQNP